MEFLNLKKIAFRLAFALIVFQVLNTYFLYNNFQQSDVQNRQDRLRSATVEAVFRHSKEELVDLASRYSLWHIYVLRVTPSSQELVQSSASPEEIASSTKPILSYEVIDEALKSDKDTYLYKFKNGFNKIEAMICTTYCHEDDIVAVAEIQLYENFLFSKPFLKAITQSSISFFIVIFFFIYIYVTFYRSSEKIIKKVEETDEKFKDATINRDFIYNSMFDMVVVLNSSGRIVDVNDAFLKVGNYKKDDLVNSLFLNFVSQECENDVKMLVYGNKNDNYNVKGEIAIKSKHSGVLTYCFMEVLPFEDNGVEYLYLFLRDITELKSTKKKLQKLNSEMFEKIKESTNYSRFILDSEPNIIWVQNREQIVDANKAFFDFFCNSNRDLDDFNKNHKNVFEMFDAVDRPDYIYDFERKDTLAFLLTHRHRSFKSSYTKGGRKYIFKINANYIMGITQKNPMNDLFIVILTDITESEMIKDKEINLVRSSTIGKLAAGITHEINTPVTYMKGNFELLKEELKDMENFDVEFVGGLVDSIEDGIGRVETIIRSMKELNVKSTDNLEKLDIIDSIITAVNMVQVRAKYLAKIYIKDESFDQAAKLKGKFFAYASMQKLEQVWIIIINNSLDEFTRSDLVYEDRRIDIDIIKDEFFVKVFVRDNAGGIPESAMDKIFDPMFSTKTSSGMGLGLNITKKIMDSLKGDIIAYNDANGAVFEVNIPIIK